METMNFGKSIEKITAFEASASGDRERKIVYRKRGRRKKQSKLLKPAEKMTRRMMEASIVGMSTYLDRHNRSNERKRNGWIKQYLKNTSKAGRRARKVFQDD